MTTMAPNERCAACGGVLVPALLGGRNVPRSADTVCWKCRAAYRWAGSPPQLTSLVEAAPTDAKSEGDELNNAVRGRHNCASARTVFRSEDDNFEVMFQSTPDIQEEGTVPTRKTKLFTEARASMLFQVRVAVTPPHFGSAVDFLHNTLNALATTMPQPILTRVSNLEHRGLPALRFSFTSAARQGDGLLVLQSRTLFTVIAIDHSVVGVERSQFVESFNVLMPTP